MKSSFWHEYFGKFWNSRINFHVLLWHWNLIKMDTKQTNKAAFWVVLKFVNESRDGPGPRMESEALARDIQALKNESLLMVRSASWVTFIYHCTVGHTEILPQFSQKCPRPKRPTNSRNQKHTHQISRIRYNCLSTEENIIQISWWEHLEIRIEKSTHLADAFAPGIEHTPASLPLQRKTLSLDPWIGLRCPIFLINVSKTKKQRVYQFLELPAIKRYIARSIYLAASRRRLDFARDVGSKGENNSIR